MGQGQAPGAPVDVGAGTLPGVGGDAQESTGATVATGAPVRADGARAETLPAPHGRTAVESADTLAAPHGRAAVESADTLAAPHGRAAVESADTLAAPHAETLPGPYKEADLPALPRVDDQTYAIGTEIARGGMGKILAARDRRLRREVVIKVMRRESDRVDPRFEREALITARLQHPSIVRVYDAGVFGDGRAFYAMERVRGRSLDVVLAEATTLRERLALLPHAIAVCDALAYAHNEGIVHRDLKPSNVLLGPFGETVVIDWGLAKDLRAGEPEAAASADGSERANDSGDSQLTQHGAVMGTPAFMAPEQARGEPADERTDVYALGALLYTILTGAPPHRGASSDEVLDAVVAGRRVPIAVAEPGLPPELVTIVEHAMAHDRDARYASAKTLADDLRAFAAGQLVPRHSYTTWQLVRRWLSRHRLPVGIAAAAIVLLAITGVIAVRNVLRERDIAHRARHAAETAKDRFVLEQARDAVASDPSRAAAWLATLSDAALAWPEVHALASELPAHGLAFELPGHRQDLELVVIAPDGMHAASASDDTTVRWWDLRTQRSVELPGHTGPLEAVAISGDGRYLASAGTDHTVMLWELSSLRSRKLVGHGNAVRGVAFSPDHTRLASTSEDGGLWLWDVATGEGEQLVDYTHSLRPLVWLDTSTLLVGAFDGALGRIDVTTRRASWTRNHRAELRCIALTPDRRRVLLGDEDGRLAVWTLDGKRVRELTQHVDVVRDVIVTPDGAHVVSAGGDDVVYVHALPSGEVTELVGHAAGVKDIDVSRDGTLVASAGIDNTVRVWTLDGTPVHVFRGHTAAVKGVGFAGDVLVSGAEDKLVRVWPLAPPPPPPHGVALRGWLAARTNVVVGREPAVQQ